MAFTLSDVIVKLCGPKKQTICSRQIASQIDSSIQFFTYIDLGVITMQVQLAEIKNKMSEYVRAVQNGSTFEITVRGVPVAMLMPIAKPSSKSGFQERVMSLMANPEAPKLDITAALQEGRK
jgi:prevent-host-death family protein